MAADSATALKPLDLNTLRAIAGKLASPHDNEVLSAAHLLVRMLAAHKLRPEDLIRLPSDPDIVAPAGRHRENPFAGGPFGFNQARARETNTRSEEMWARFRDAMAAVADAEPAPGADGTPQNEAGWKELLAKVRAKAAGTKLLDEQEEKLVFYTLHIALTNGLSPASAQLGRLMTIARRLGIV